MAKRNWQDKAWDFYRAMPEIRYPANFFGSSLSQFVPRVGLIPSDDPTATAIVPEGDNKPDIVKMAEEQLASIEGPFGGMREILFRRRLAGRHRHHGGHQLGVPLGEGTNL